MSSGNSTNSKPQTSTGKAESKGEIQFTAELEEILKRITEIKNIAGLNFINVFTYEFFIRTSFRQLFLVTFWLWQKIRTKNEREKCWWNWPQVVSISSTFYARLFCKKVFCTVFQLQFGFVIFWHKNIGAKAARKMLMKLAFCTYC